MNRLCITLLLASLFMGSAALAEQQQLQEVVITATKTQQNIEESPATVDVVTSETIKKTNARFADEALRNLPGVYSERRDGVLGLSDSFAPIHLRGMPNASQTLVLLDGQAMNNYEGNIHWWSIPVENIDRIEVVRGPTSSLYGGGAMGGVINIITKTDHSPLEVSYGRGSYKTETASIGHGGSFGDLTYSIVARSMKMDDPEETSTTSRPGTNTVEVPTADGGVTYIQGYQRLESSSNALTAGISWDMSAESYLNLKYTHATYKLDPEATQTFDGAYLSASYREHATNNYLLSYYNADIENLEILFNAGLTDNYKDLFIWNNNSGDSVRPNSHYNAGLQTNITLNKNILTLGTDWTQGRVSSVDEGSTPEPDDDQMTKGSTRTIGFYLQDQFDATDTITLYAGARYDSWKSFNAETNSADLGFPIDTPSSSETYVSPKISLVYRPDANTTFRASAGDAFRGPTLWEAFKYSRGRRGTSLPNPDLNPETTRSYELGLDRKLSPVVKVGFTYFTNNFNDLIYQVDTADLDGDGNNDYRYENVAEAWTRGYEATVDLTITNDLGLFFNFTKTYTRISDVDNPVLAEQIEGKEFTDIPKNAFNIGLDYDDGTVFSNLTLRYVGDRYMNDDNSDIYDYRMDGYDPYSVIDFNLGYRSEHFEITGAIYNAFDKTYWESYDESTGRTFFIKATAKL